jgi:RNA polymerase sigma-70 factor (ECF subfamily)
LSRQQAAEWPEVKLDETIPSQWAEWLFIHHWNDLERFALRLIANPSAAEDLTADVFSSLIAGDFDSRSVPLDKALGFARAVIRNRAMHEHRRSRRAVFAGPFPAPTAGTNEQDLLDSSIDLRRAIAELPCEQRRTLHLHLWGLATSEIAAHEQVSTSAIRVRLHRARASLRKALDMPADVQ